MSGGHLPRLNILVNNAGLMHCYDLTQPLDARNVMAEVGTNLLAPLHLSCLLVAHLQQQPTAAIVNVTSGLAFTPLAQVPVYCATKAGLYTFCLSLRYQLRHTSVKVFEIIPPAVATNLGHEDGYDRSQDQAMEIDLFTDYFLRVLEHDQYEVGIGSAEDLRQQRDALFTVLNPEA